MQPTSSTVGIDSPSAKKRSYHDRKDDDEETEETFESKKAKLHSLDSDEEDEHESEKQKYNIAEVESRMFDGQEKATIDYDGDIKITAFNMEEEMQEETNKGLADSDSEEESSANVDIKSIYEKMLKLMKPGENVLKCIKRLGGQQGKNKREKKKLEPEQQKILEEMIMYANDILSTGDMDIYERTYEQMKLVLTPKKNAEMDMFSEDVPPAVTTASTSTEATLDENKVLWEYKWEDKDGAEVFGPYPSEDMLAWTQEGYFGNGVFVRKQKEERFYSSKRIDFDLYV